MDLLLQELASSPASLGVIVFRPTADDPVFPYREKATIINHLKFRNFDQGRIVFLIGDRDEKFTTELWMVSTGMHESVRGKPLDFKVSRIPRSLFVRSEAWNDGIGCGTVFLEKEAFAEIIKNNEGINGRVVIKVSSESKFTVFKARIIEILVSKYKVPSDRLEFIYDKDHRMVDEEYYVYPRHPQKSTDRLN